jgi:hypothetical protein
MATKYSGDIWRLPWNDLYSFQCVVLYKVGNDGTWMQITNEAPNGNDATVLDPENTSQQDPHSGYYDWAIDLAEDSLEVYCRVADKDLWDAENPDDGEYVDFGPFDIEVRVLTSIVLSPPAVRMEKEKQRTFTVVCLDQTQTALDTQPEVTFTTDSIYGSITQQGVFTAGATEEVCTVTATVGEISGTATVAVLERISRSSRKSTHIGLAIST